MLTVLRVVYAIVRLRQDYDIMRYYAHGSSIIMRTVRAKPASLHIYVHSLSETCCFVRTRWRLKTTAQDEFPVGC